MHALRRAERVIATIAWAIVAAFLFTGFSWVSGGWLASTAQALGLLDASRVELAEHVSRAGLGVAMLGLSRLYRKLDDRENAGSMAAWLSGWTVVLFSVASLASLVDDQAAPLALVVVLLVWSTVRMTRYFATLDDEEEDPGG